MSVFIQERPTRLSYSYKWERFSTFMSFRGTSPSSSSLSNIFDFLLLQKHLDLGHSSLRVYLATIFAYCSWIDRFSVFSHPLVKRFIQGLLHLYPQVRPPPPAWDLSLVLRRLTRHPFEPMASCDLRLLAWKTAFLVTITSERRVSRTGCAVSYATLSGFSTPLCSTPAGHYLSAKSGLTISSFCGHYFARFLSESGY